MSIAPTRVRKGTAVAFGSIAASAALVLAGMTSAFADDVQIGPEDVAGFENPDENSDDFNYEQWHIGSTTDPTATVEDSLTFSECSVEFLPPASSTSTVTQLLKGLPVGQRTDSLDAMESVVNGLAVEMVSGSVTLQIPMFIYEDENDESPEFTTVRNANAFTEAGTHTLEGEPLTSTNGFGDFDSPEAFLEVLAARADEGQRFVALGFGITGEEGSVVASLRAMGDTYFFGTGSCLPDSGGGGDDDDDSDDDSGASQAPTRPVAVETGH